MFISEKIPSTFNYIAEFGDNYVVLVNRSKLDSGINYEAYYQYFSPSELVIHTDTYKIKTGDSYVYDYVYDNNQFYSYIDYVEPTYSITCSEVENRTNDVFDRPDYGLIFMVVFLFLLLYIIIFNLVTSLVHKGGLFFG